MSLVRAAWAQTLTLAALVAPQLKHTLALPQQHWVTTIESLLWNSICHPSVLSIPGLSVGNAVGSFPQEALLKADFTARPVLLMTCNSSQLLYM